MLGTVLTLYLWGIPPLHASHFQTELQRWPTLSAYRHRILTKPWSILGKHSQWVVAQISGASPRPPSPSFVARWRGSVRGVMCDGGAWFGNGVGGMRRGGWGAAEASHSSVSSRMCAYT